jgi:hypothetical protein
VSQVLTLEVRDGKIIIAGQTITDAGHPIGP